MSDTITHKAIKVTESDEQLLAQWLGEIELMNEQMQRDQERITRTKTEIVALRNETHRLKAETRAALARMGERL